MGHRHAPRDWPAGRCARAAFVSDVIICVRHRTLAARELGVLWHRWCILKTMYMYMCHIIICICVTSYVYVSHHQTSLVHPESIGHVWDIRTYMGYIRTCIGYKDIYGIYKDMYEIQGYIWCVRTYMGYIRTYKQLQHRWSQHGTPASGTAGSS